MILGMVFVGDNGIIEEKMIPLLMLMLMLVSGSWIFE